MKEEEKISEIQTNRVMAEAFMKPYHERWEKHFDFYMGKQGEKKIVEEERITVNLLPRIVRIILARTYFKNPYITISPRGRENEGAARMTEGAINYEQDEIMQKIQIKRAIISALMYDFGAVKIGYSFKTGMERQSEYIKEDRIFCQWLPSDSVFFDPEPAFREGCRWAYEIILKPLKEVKENSTYENTDDLKATASLKEGLLEGMKEKERKGDSLKRVKLILYWDIYNNKFTVLADKHDKILREIDMDEIFAGEGFPIKFLCLDEVPGLLSGRSILTDLIPQQNELNLARSAEIARWKRFRQKYQYRGSDGIDPKEIAKFERNKEGSVIKTEGEGIRLIPNAPPSPELLRAGDVQQEDMRRIGGIGEQQWGGAIKGVETASEASIIEKGVSLITDEKLDAVEDFCTLIARGEIQLMRDNYDAERWAKIKGDNGFEFVRYTKEDLHGEYDIKVQAGSTLPESKEVRRRLSLDALNIFAHPSFDEFVDKRVLLEDTVKALDANPRIIKPPLAEAPPLTEEEVSAMESGEMTPEEYKGALAEGETRRALLPRLLSRGGGPTLAHTLSAAERK